MSGQFQAPVALFQGNRAEYSLDRGPGGLYKEKWKLLTLSGFELRLLGRPARSQSLYRLRYSGFHTTLIEKQIIFS
jgi:hypothetical protein